MIVRLDQTKLLGFRLATNGGDVVIGAKLGTKGPGGGGDPDVPFPTDEIPGGPGSGGPTPAP
jgi:hypothetical protein